MSKMISGTVLAAATVLAVFFITEPMGSDIVRCLGKAVWYVPYVLLIGAVRCLKAA